MPIPMDKKKNLIIGIIVFILLLNVIWTVLQNKFTPKLDEVKSQMLKLEQRISKIESSGIPDIAGLKDDFNMLKSFSTSFTESLNNSIKAEEERLNSLQSQVENQKTRVEALKKLLPSEN